MRVEGSQLSGGGYRTEGTVLPDLARSAATTVGDSAEEKMPNEVVKKENQEISRKELQKKVAQLNQAAEVLERKFKFQIHEETNRIIVKVLRKDNGELIAEIPPRRILDVLAKIDEEMGLLVDTKA
jgi:flagellar protein FlaG